MSEVLICRSMKQLQKYFEFIILPFIVIIRGQVWKTNASMSSDAYYRLIGFSYSTNRLVKSSVFHQKEKEYWIFVKNNIPVVTRFKQQLADIYPFAKLTISGPENVLSVVNQRINHK